MAYDAAKRLIRQTNALGGVSWFSDTLDANTQHILATTNADGGIRIEAYFRDGQLASVTGAASFPSRLEYGQEVDGSYHCAYRKEIKLDSGYSDTLEWIKTYTDGAGHAYKTVYAGSGGPYRQSFFNGSGQLWKERDPDGVVALYAYNALGERAYTAIDSNRNDVIDFSSLDRITETTNYVVASHGTNVVRRETWIWKDNGSSTRTLLSSIETSVEGLKGWQTNAGVLSSTVRTLPSSGTYSVTQTGPEGAYSIGLYTTGRVVSITAYDSNNVQIAKTSYGYDTHGRQSTIADARNGTTALTFNNADRSVTVTTPLPGTGDPPQTTTTYYDKMLRATNTVAADGGSVTNILSLRGETVLTKGARTYPTGYAFDAQGRQTNMTTWSNFASLSGARVTTWNYDTQRGWLTNKVYPDGLGPKYSYTAAGRLATRLWARGTNTSYSYNNFGDLSGLAYNDGATANLTYTFSRRGQQEIVTQGTNSWKLFYTLDGQILSEAWTGGMLNGVAVTNQFDWLLRRTNVSTMSGASALTSHGYSYNAGGRMDTARDGNYSAVYSYLANSPLVSQITFKSNTIVRLTTTKQYDLLNRLSAIANQPSADSPVSFNYTYNSANQRTRAGLADNSYWVYKYDALGQVISGKKYWEDGTPVAGQQFEYAFDDIGNRVSIKSGGDSSGGNLRVANYTNNTLNQITSRDVPGAVDIIGAATATATNVNVNGQMAYRRGEYYQVALSLNNASSAQWQSVTNQAIQSGVSSNQIGNVFLPKTAEVFSYDADGNLTNDGRWMLIWDAENRLVQVESQSSAPSGSKRRAAYSYDWRGRLMRRTEYNGSSGTYVITNDLKFLADDWRCLAELNATNAALVRNYLWGTDLSRTLTGAGGAGGLLALDSTVNGVHFYASDGNGNVVGLAKGIDGSASAGYEFDPFGQTLRRTGALASENSHEFSTKRTDNLTDWVHYEYRVLRSSLGSWTSRDPIGEGGLADPYQFVRNDPVDFVDFLGLAKIRFKYEAYIETATITYRGRTFNGGTKVRHEVEIDTKAHSLTEIEKYIGPTIEYDPNGNVIRNGQASGSTVTAELWDEFMDCPKRWFKVVMDGNESNPLASLAAGITWHVDIWVYPCRKEITWQGSHDKFPSHDFYVNGSIRHHFSHIDSGTSPASLYPFTSSEYFGGRTSY